MINEITLDELKNKQISIYPEFGVATSVSWEMGVLRDVESQLDVSTNSESSVSPPTFRLPPFHKSSAVFRFAFLLWLGFSGESSQQTEK